MKFAVSAFAVVLLFNPSTASAAGNKAAKPDGIRGVVTSVDTTGKTFTLRTGKKKNDTVQERTIQFDQNTKFLTLGDDGPVDAKSDDLTAKTRVAVVFETKDGKNLATKVTILPRPAKK